MRIKTSDEQVEDFALYDGLTVADFFSSVFANLKKLGIEPKIKAIPYEAPSTTPFAEDTENKSYDKEYVERFHRTLVAVDHILTEFRGRFVGKSTPVHMFWHSFDLALTRFSGKRAAVREGAGIVEREAYSHEVISFGFWFGDDQGPGACVLFIHGSRARGPGGRTAVTNASKMGRIKRRSPGALDV